ncbi:uncharacterized protein LOC105387937 isoform X1 [Plutella xylostella]|uniref:uncharacterized protein LOC105387937 isoform X1 n=1 Tax=Plutella xylostella TaxID=51655 RepID=UPI002032EE48|nr:uncharacterized protein LOC105387937 isoform X1 [Plutella xylostella]
MSGQAASPGRLLVYVADPGSRREPPQPPPLHHPYSLPHYYPLRYKDDAKLSDRPDLAKQEQQNIEYNVESFQGGIPVNSGESYQARCPPVGAESSSSPMQAVLLRPGQHQLSESVRSGSETNCSDREPVDKSFLNYQFLEQSVTHQSIVNQSISILNQQVGVNRGVSGEGDSGNAPQLVRTADGVVLAVLPSAQHVNEPELGSRTVQSDCLQTIVVPLGWRRIITGTSVLYVSPSGTALSTLQQLREYLQTTGTCKCGLPCPLRPETAFSFDHKVSSKPYQPPSSGELTKLCNHKRKLLATLSARAQSPATPPPPPAEQIKGAPEAATKKKMKKRHNYPNMSLSQMMVQRDRPAGEMKVHEMDPNRTSVSPGVSQRGKPQPGPYPPAPPAAPAHPPHPAEDKQEPPRGPHYLTVNSGWIQQETRDSNSSLSAAMNVGMPVIGTNGQIIGVNTGYKHNHNYKPVNNTTTAPEETKEEKKDAGKEKEKEESQIFCGLNQALTPEVMQKINEQQQLFIQQNKNQIEMAMKGYRTQLENTNQNKVNQNQYMPQGQLVIQNGAVVKANPAKTPPWQVKRNDSNPMASPSPKSQKSDNMDFDESSNNLSEESTSSNSSFQNEQMNQSMCSRVPPLPQQYNIMGQQWPGIDMQKKKPKNNKGGKKKASPTDNKGMIYNNGMRMMDKGKSCDEMSHNVPSFMEDPNGYLAQQTVLLNNTISRQVGMNSSFDNTRYDGPSHSYNQMQDKSKQPMKQNDLPNVFRNNMAPNSSPSHINTPDSSVISDKNIETSLPQCCKGCNVNPKTNSEIYSEQQIRRTYMKQNVYNKMELDTNSATSSPKHSFDDNPVTSSTFIDRSPLVNDNCGPIQAATVSTSNVSPTETLQPPEPSPTPSNSSRNTDTPCSNSVQNCTFPMPSPAYSNPGSNRDNFNSNPSTPGGNYPYNSPGPPVSHSLSGTQMMHFISNHNVNKNLMEVDNISMVGVKPGLKQEMYRLDGRKRMENAMPGYCPPPHLGSGPSHSLVQACYVQTFVTTMASGFSVTRDTVTSVLAGKANTVTTSINASHANFIRPPPPPSVNLATTYAIPNNHPDPFIHSVNLPTSYPLHIAGTTAQNMISKSPLEMVQNALGNYPPKSETNNTQTSSVNQIGRRTCPTVTPGQILISSTGQIIVSNSTMPPPPPKTTTSQIQSSVSVTNVTTSISQVVPTVQPVVNQPAVVVNALQTPFVLQPPMMVDGSVVQQNSVLPQLVAGVQNQSPESQRHIDVKNGQGFVQGVAMLSPESLKKKSKKKKSHANVTNVLQITAPQQNTNNIMVHHSSPQHNTSPQFSPRGFQLSPNNSISPGPMLQALTIVPGKSGTPAHIVMNGQGNTNNFGSQQIITNTSPSQQINLLQPVNLINNSSGVVPNFPAFQQFIVPNLGGMVMTADGTAIIQDNGTGVPMQLQLQTVNGQNVLTPVQNQNVFAGANGGVVIRAQNQQGKIIQSQHSPGAQFLSPNSQVMMSSPNFNGQLSPLLANLSPTNVTFNTSPHQVRSSNVQTQEFIQTNQMGQTLMVPLSPKQVSLSSGTTNRSNSTFVQQNTTIVQQQTTLVSNSHNNHGASLGNSSRLSIDPNVLLNTAHKQITNQIKNRNFVEMPPELHAEESKEEKTQPFPEDVKLDSQENYAKFISDFNPMLGQIQGNMAYGNHVRHSVSTQTLVNQQRGKSPNSQAISGSSPPDTTTHSPLGALESNASSPRLYGARSMSTQGNYADTTTKSPEPADANSSAMVQCVSSSEQDVEHAWPPDFAADTDTSLMSNIQLMRQTRHTHNSVESTEIHYSQNQINVNQQNVMPMTPNYYDRNQQYKRKNEFSDGSYRNDKIMRTNYNMVHGQQKEPEYDLNTDKTPKRHFSTSGSSSENSSIQKVFDRHSLGNDTQDVEPVKEAPNPPAAEKSKFAVGDLIWGPVKGYTSWPGKLVDRCEDGRWSVRWFGADKAAGTAEDARLMTLSEGLEAHHAARTKHRKSRKLNTHLENAIQEAMAELDKKCDGTGEAMDVTPEASGSAITDTPKRGKKDKKNKDRCKKAGLVKIAPNTSKSGDGARLRSSR